MSQNAEPKRKWAEINQVEWEALTDAQRTAVKAAVSAYANSPGNSENMAMWRAINAYAASMQGRK